MNKKISTISLSLPFRMGNVNCYLITARTGYALIDTGGLNNRKELVKELEHLGCRPGDLKIILITHGDFDHTGNAAYIRDKFAAKIGMHTDDAGMAEHGDMFVNRKQPNIIIRKLLPLFTGFGESERFVPDILLEDGDDLNKYGLDAKIISIPGHSKGSIAILTAASDLFCGDLLVNTDKPALGPLIDDSTAAYTSFQKLSSLETCTVYPGHGRPFPMQQLIAGNT